MNQNIFSLDENTNHSVFNFFQNGKIEFDNDDIEFPVERMTASREDSIPDKSITVTISTDYYQGFDAFGKIYRFGPSKAKFKKPAKLTIPYKYYEGMAEDVVNVYYYNQEDKSWEIINKLSQDKENKTITVEIDHFSDYAAGSGSYKVDESGSFSNISAAGNVDPYTGTLSFTRTDFSISASGLDLSLSSTFSSDYAYADIFPAATQISEDFDSSVSVTAGISTVAKPNNNYYPIAKGWSWNLPYTDFDEDHYWTEPSKDKNRLQICLSRGRKIIFKSALESYGQTKWIEGYHVEWNGSIVTIQMPENKLTIKAQVERKGLFKHCHVQWVEIYPGDGKVLKFETDGRIKLITDYSGKNRLEFYYNGNKISRVQHSDGRCIKFYEYAITGGTALVTVLSTDSSHTEFKAGDKFLNKYVIDFNNNLTSFSALQTELETDTTGFTLTSANESTRFTTMQTVTYTYTLSSSVTDNSIKITNPTSSTLEYFFAPQKAYCHVYNTGSTVQYDGQTLTKYDGYFLNKPKVIKEEIKENYSDTTYRFTTYEYTEGGAYDSSNHSEIPYTGSGEDIKLDVPSVLNSITKIYTMKKRPSTQDYFVKSEIYYEHDMDKDNKPLKGQSETKVFKNSGDLTSPTWAQIARTTSAFSLLENVDGMYLPNESKSFINDQVEEKTKSTTAYDSFGRTLKNETFYRNEALDLVTNGKKFYQYIDGVCHDEATDIFSDNNFATDKYIDSKNVTIDSNKDVYKGRGFFNLMSGIATEIYSGTYHKVYTKYDNNLNVIALKNIEYSSIGERKPEAITELLYDETTNVLNGMIYPDKKEISMKYGASGFLKSYIVSDEKIIDNNINGEKQIFKNTFDYDIKGRLKKKETFTTNEDGVIYEPTKYPKMTLDYEYDDMNRVLVKKFNTTPVIKYVYDEGNKRVLKTDHLGFGTITWYDNLYRVNKIQTYKPKSYAYQNIDVDITGSNVLQISESQYIYDVVYGLVDTIKVTDPLFATLNDTNKYICTHTVYDVLTRPIDSYIKATDSTWKPADGGTPAIHTSQTIYDEVNNITRNKIWFNALDWTESYTKNDWLGRVIETRSYENKNTTDNPLISKTYYNYAGATTSTVLPNNDEYKFYYSTTGKIEKLEYPDGSYESKIYDLNGNTDTIIDRGGVKTKFYYNNSNIPFKQETFVEGKPTITIETKFCHLGAVQITQKEGTDKDLKTISEYNYEYAACGSPSKIEQKVNGKTTSVEYTYDAVGTPLTTTVTGAGGYSKTIKMDLQWHPSGEDTDRFNITAIKDNSDNMLIKSKGSYSGNISSIAYGSDIKTTTYSYDNLLRLIGISNQDSTSFTYERDLSGNITKIGTTNYTYDALGRLTNNSNEAITFDSINNLLTRETSSIKKEYTYLPTDKVKKTNQMKLVKFEEKEISSNKVLKSWNLDYDARGNIIGISDRFEELEYDAVGRLRSVKYSK